MIPEKAIKPIKTKRRDNTEIATSTLIAYGVFPHTDEGIRKAKKLIASSDEWLVPSELPEYYDGIDSDIMVGRDTPSIISIRQKLKEFYKLSAGTVDFVDTSAPTEEELVGPPKLPPAHYIQGQAGRWQPEFENDIDHAVYFAGKSPLPKGSKQREVLEWLKSLGLTFQQIHDHREAVLEKIRETIALPGVEEEYPYVYIDAVDQDFVIDDDEDYEETEDDIEDLDDLLNDVRNDKEISNKKISEDIEEEIVDAAGDDDEEDPMANVDIDIQAIADGDEDVLTDAAGKLTGVLNKPKKESTYTSNKKILESVIVNFGKIQSTLDTINNNLEKQNVLIKSNIESQLVVGDLISNQTSVLEGKFDLLLEAFDNQLQQSKNLRDAEEKRAAEDALEAQRDAAGIADFQDLTKKKDKGKGRESKIGLYYKRKLLRQLYKKAPKKLRSLRSKARRIQRTPGRIVNRIKSSAANRITNMLPKRAANFSNNLRTARNAAQGMGGVSKLKGAGRNIPGLRQALAVWEYSDRKAVGQSDIQAMAGVGGGLAGAAAGAAIGTMLFPGVGTVAGLLIGAAFSAAGGYAGSKIADTVSGADKVDGEHEIGTTQTKPGTAILHGTEAVIPNNLDMSPINTIGGVMIAATTDYINSAGAIAAPIAPTLKGISSQMAKQYDVPNVLTQTNVGGSLPSLDKQLKKVKDKRKQTPEEELSGMEKDLLETQDPESFADKLLKMIDPEGKFQELLKQINQKNPVGETGEGMATFGETGIDKGTGSNAQGWVHGHFQNSNKASLINDTFDVVKRLVNNGVKTVITSSNKDITKDMSDDEIKKHIEAGISGHKKYASGVYAIDVSVPVGTKVPFELENVYDSKGPGGIVGTMKGKTTQIMHLAPGSKSGAAPAPSGTKPSGPMPSGVSQNEISELTDSRNPTKLIIGAGHVDTPGKPGSGQGTTDPSTRVRETAATQHMLRALQSLVGADPELKDKIGFSSFNNDNFARDNTNKYTNKGMQFLELHFDQYGGAGRSGLIPSRNARAGVTGNAGTSGFDVALSKHFGNYGRDFKKGDLGIPDTGGSILELGAIDSNPKLLEEIKSGTMGPETMKLAQYTYSALRQGAAAEGWVSKAQPPSNSRPRIESMNKAGTSENEKYLIINQQTKPIISAGRNSTVDFVSMGDGRWRTKDEISTTMRNLYIQRLGQ